MSRSLAEMMRKQALVFIFKRMAIKAKLLNCQSEPINLNCFRSFRREDVIYGLRDSRSLERVGCCFFSVSIGGRLPASLRDESENEAC